MVEGREHHAVQGRGTPHGFEHTGLEASTAAPLQLDVDGQGHGGQHLGQCRDALTGELGREPGAGIECAQTSQRMHRDEPTSVGGAIDGIVVQNHDGAVGGELYVQLDHVRAQPLGPYEGGQRVLRGRPARTAMCDHGRHAAPLGRRPLPVNGAVVDSPPRGHRCSRVVTNDPPAWTALLVDVPSAAAEAVASFLFDAGVLGLLTDDATEPAGLRVRLEAHVPRAQGDHVAEALRTFLGELARLDTGMAGARLAVTDFADRSWEESFRAHHHPRPVGRKLRVAPPWDSAPDGGRETIVIDPGMAFGTGQHATTRACLEEVEEAVDAGARSGLDVGTGTGILAIALARLGVPRVTAVDTDGVALRLARIACAENRAAVVRLVVGTAAAVRGTFDVVLANLLVDVIVAEADVLAARVAPRGRLILSGLLADQTDRAAAAFPDWTVTHERGDDPWRALRLERAR
jgi:ribosomal protein L11 methyltransferase